MKIVHYFKHFDELNSNLFQLLNDQTIVVCLNEKQKSDLQQQIFNHNFLSSSQVLTYSQLQEMMFPKNLILIEDIKRYLALYVSIPADLKEKYRLNDYFSSVEFLNHVMKYFSDCKEICTHPKDIFYRIEDDCEWKDWQTQMLNDLLIIYQNYHEYLVNRGFTDSVFYDINEMSSDQLDSYTQMIFYAFYEWKLWDIKCLEFLESKLQIHLFNLGHQSVFDSQGLNLKKVQWDDFFDTSTELKNKLQIFKSKNAFGLQRQVLNYLSDVQANTIVDFDIEQSTFYQKVNPDVFEISTKKDFNQSHLYKFLAQISEALSEMMIEPQRNKQLIPLKSVFHLLQQEEIYKILNVNKTESLKLSLSRIFTLLNAESLFYLDFDQECLNLFKKDFFEDEALALIQQTLLLLKTYDAFDNMDDLLKYLSNWEQNQLYRLLLDQSIDSSDEIEVFLTAMNNIKGILKLQVIDSFSSISPSKKQSGVNLSFVLEFLRAKQFKVKREKTEQTKIRVLEFSQSYAQKTKATLMLNLQENHLPSVRKAPFILMDYQKKKLGLKNYDQEQLIEKYLFISLIRNATQMAFFYHENQDENVQRSSFLEELLLFTGIIEPVELDDIDYQDFYQKRFPLTNPILPDSSQLHTLSFYKMPFHCESPFELSYYSWAKLKQNSFSWYLDFYRHFSRFNPLEKPHLSYLNLGVLVHKLIEKVINDKSLHRLTSQSDMVQRILVMIDQEIADPRTFYYKMPHNFDEAFFNLFLRDFLAENIVHFLLGIDLLNADQKMITEEDFSYLHSVRENLSVKMKGKVDLYLSVDEQHCIIDIKTGNGSKEQLDFYRVLWFNQMKDYWEVFVSKIHNILTKYPYCREQIDSEEEMITKNSKLLDQIDEEIIRLFDQACVPAERMNKKDEYHLISRQKEFLHLLSERKTS